MRLRTERGVGEDWPITYDELAPYYEQAEAFIGVSGPQSYPWDAARRYPLPPVPRNAPAQMMAKACAALGIRATDAPAAVLSRDFAQVGGGLRPACINCGYCHQGCRIGAKTSMDVTYLPLAVAAGAEIRPDCFAPRPGAGPGGPHYGRDLSLRGRGCPAEMWRRLPLRRRRGDAAPAVCIWAWPIPAVRSGAIYMAHVATQVWGRFQQDMPVP